MSRLRQSSVQLPHPVDARVHSFSCDSVLTPFSWMASMMVPLVTPMQPQTVSLSAIWAASAPGIRPGGKEQVLRYRRKIRSAAQPFHIARAV